MSVLVQGSQARPWVVDAAPTNGTSGTGAGLAEPGSLLIDVTNKRTYQNTNTKASPTWTRQESGAAGTIPNDALAAPNLKVLTETHLVSEFTDGGATVGTLDLDGEIPAGAYVLTSKVVVNVALNGDTSAALTIGDGTDADRYNTSTIDVFTSGEKAAGEPSGTRYHTAAKTPKLTVTSTADFTNVAAAGSLTVSIYYVETV